MKPIPSIQRIAAVLSCALALSATRARASIAYGSINNFDTVNDTSHECHGFEIEIEDCHSADITYTYNYNHYGVPEITEDNSVAGHPKTLIRWVSKKNPDGTWAAFTAIPSGPIDPTNGHQFTNPNVNFGGEHFGAGYRAAVGQIHYRWLIDNGSGTLVNGGDVQVATPTFTYFPAVAGVPAQVRAAIQPPPQEVHVKEFGNPVWVKEIRTTSHNNNKVHLRDLVSDDPDNPEDKNWRNGEPDEVETEWQLMQVEFSKLDGGANGNLEAAPEDLNDGDEVVTRRYEFFEYTGPIDNETGEAMADSVAADDLHGVGVKSINGVDVDLSEVEIVGEFKGSQMAAVDAEGHLDLIDHVGEGRENHPFADRNLVVEGPFPFICSIDGALPDGMTFDEITGDLSGTPSESGEFQFKVTATDFVSPDVEKNYTLRVAAAGAVLEPASLVDTAASPVGTGTTSGDGAFPPGTEVTVVATPEIGYRFQNWTDNDVVVATTESYTFTLDVNHSLVAHFVGDLPQWDIAASASPAEGGSVSGDGLADDGSNVTLTATALAGYNFLNWTDGGLVVSNQASYSFTANADRTLVANFAVAPVYSITTSSNPSAGGTTTGDGDFYNGDSATVTATADPGYVFSKWTVNGTEVNTNPSYTFTVSSNMALVAVFVAEGAMQTITTSANPVAGGTTSGGGSYASGDSATVVATANPNYKFSKWQENGGTVSTSASYTFTVAGNRNLVARFTEAFVINASCSPAVGGTTEMDSSSYKTGENAKAKAFPEAGFTFLNWTENGVVVSTDESYSFNVTGVRNLVAHFVADDGVTINASCDPSAGGTIWGDDVYQFDDDVLVSAVPNDGYAFVSWTDGGAVVSLDPDYYFMADANRQLVAHFAPPASITLSASPAEGGSVFGDGDYAIGALAFVWVEANPGYAFNGWTEGANPVSNLADYEFEVTGARNLVANFIAIPNIVVNRGAPGADSMTITWPAASSGWVLEESPDLMNWSLSARQIDTNGGEKSVTIPTTDGHRYFRLAHP